MSVPDSFDVDLSGSVGTRVSGGLAIDITHIPKLSLTLDPLDVNLRPLDITIRPLDITVRPLDIKLQPIDLSIALKEVPRIRGHIPADFSLCVSILGREIAALRLCGEAQVITEPYKANPCEVCGDANDLRLQPVLKLEVHE